METYSISLYRKAQNHFSINAFEEALRYSKLCYKLRHLQLASFTMQEEELQTALEKAIKVCKLAGINSNEHFKSIYIGDSDSGTIYKDLLMSKKGFNLIMTQLPVNEQTSCWIWELVNI